MRPIFIVGLPRSGTTLMSSMLTAHPRITISPESHFLRYWTKRYSDLNISHPDDFEFFWKEFSKSEQFSHFGINIEATLARILAFDQINYRTIFHCLLQEYASKMGKPRWGEKTPDHYCDVKTLFEWYPQARVIWMLRDPRAVIASLLNVPWANKSVEVNARKWYNSIQIFNQEWINDERVRLFRYEALVENPEIEMLQVCEFLEEEYTPDMINNRSKANKPIINRSGWAKDYLEATLKPINTTSIEKWRSALSPQQIATVESINRKKMLEYGYQPVSSRINIYSLRGFLGKASSKMKNVVLNTPRFLNK